MTVSDTMHVKRTALHDLHVVLGAKIEPFAGYAMPLSYEGFIAEHTAVRERVGVFDLSHMGEFIVEGPGAVAFLQRLTTNDVGALEAGEVQYTTMLTDAGGIVDDLLLYRLPDRYLLVVNAANIAKDYAWLERHRPGDVRLTDVSDDTALIAIQGPLAEPVAAAVLGPAVTDMRYGAVTSLTIDGREVVFSRTGYTGEDGFEIYLPPTLAPALWDATLSAGARNGIVPVGLGARDSLRLEMKFALYGNDIDETTNPIEAGLGWAVKPDKDAEFVGRDACVRMKQDKPRRRLIGFAMDSGGIPRQGYEVAVEGSALGRVTSGGHSPSLGVGIGMAYVPVEHAKPGTPLDVMIRGRAAAATVVKPPFYRHGTRK